jgi:hypothetical protein
MNNENDNNENDNNENIIFLLKDNNTIIENNFDINDLLYDNNNNLFYNNNNNNLFYNNNNNNLFYNNNNNINSNIDYNNSIYYIELSNYNGDYYAYYNENYTIKDLIKISNYYGISKNIKSSKCKKQDIIETIIYYENCIENYEIVNKRHTMWCYITELLNDTEMKKYIIWN